MKRFIFLSFGFIFLVCAFFADESRQLDLIILSWLAFLFERIEEMDAAR